MKASELLDLHVFIALDYSQAEIRILAEMSQDKLLIHQFNQPNSDIHSSVGHTLTGWSVERIKNEKKTRQLVKNMIFAIIYGVARDGLYDYIVTKIRETDGENADLTGITKKKIGQLYDAFFVKYVGVARFIDAMREMAETVGYVDSMFGFRRELRESDETRDTYWLNQAVNTPIQTSAHQLVLMAMALIGLKPKTYNRLQTAISEVHDALYFRTRLRHLKETFEQGQELLEKAVVKYAKDKFGVTMKVPLIAEGEAGFTYGSMVDYYGRPIDEFLDAWRAKHKKVEKESWEKLLPEVLV